MVASENSNDETAFTSMIVNKVQLALSVQQFSFDSLHCMDLQIFFALLLFFS